MNSKNFNFFSNSEKKKQVFVRQISAGDWHSAAVSSNGALYTWGSDKYGQCGLGSKVCLVYINIFFFDI